MKTRQLYLLFTFIFFCNVLIAQCENWTDKFKIITFKGDTIDNAYGKDMEYLHLTNYVFYYRLKNGNKCKLKKMNVLDIKEIKYGGYQYFHKELRNGTIGFLSLIHDKEIKYYTGTYRVKIPKKYGPSIFKSEKRKNGGAFYDYKHYTYHYIEKDGKVIYIKQKLGRLWKQMNKLFGASPEVQKLLAEDSFSIYYIIGIIDAYLEWKKDQLPEND